MWLAIQKKVISKPNSQAVKKECGPQKGQGEKRCEIKSGGQEMAVMVGSWQKNLIMTIQVNLVPSPSGGGNANLPELS